MVLESDMTLSTSSLNPKLCRIAKITVIEPVEERKIRNPTESCWSGWNSYSTDILTKTDLRNSNVNSIDGKGTSVGTAKDNRAGRRYARHKAIAMLQQEIEADASGAGTRVGEENASNALIALR